MLLQFLIPFFFSFAIKQFRTTKSCIIPSSASNGGTQNPYQYLEWWPQNPWQHFQSSLEQHWVCRLTQRVFKHQFILACCWLRLPWLFCFSPPLSGPDYSLDTAPHNHCLELLWPLLGPYYSVGDPLVYTFHTVTFLIFLTPLWINLDCCTLVTAHSKELQGLLELTVHLCNWEFY